MPLNATWWNAPVTGAVWQVLLHSLVATAVVSAWLRHLRLPSGPTRRRLLGLLLVLPLLTALVPGRSTAEFRDREAWFSSQRLLPVPLAGPVRVHHVVLGLAALTTLVTLWQELVPVLWRSRVRTGPVPEAVSALVRSLPGGKGARLLLAEESDLSLSALGIPGRVRLVVSRGTLASLTPEELRLVLGHELVHVAPRRWLVSHVLFLARLAQVFSPAALWAFREYLVEVEIACDAEAVGTGDARVLARALLKTYEATDRQDLAARGTLRRRIDALLGDEVNRPGLPWATVLVAGAVLGALLPWVV